MAGFRLTRDIGPYVGATPTHDVRVFLQTRVGPGPGSHGTGVA